MPAGFSLGSRSEISMARNSSHLPTGSATHSTVMTCCPPEGMEPNPGYTVNMPWVKRACRTKVGRAGEKEAKCSTESETFQGGREIMKWRNGGASSTGGISFLLAWRQRPGMFRVDGLSVCPYLYIPSETRWNQGLKEMDNVCVIQYLSRWGNLKAAGVGWGTEWNSG